MDVFSLVDAPWRYYPAGIVVLGSLVLLWRGLLGGLNGEGGLLSRQVGMLRRLEGWRVTIFGLVLLGLGAAWIWEARWLLFLSLGFGFVEVQEASTVISAMRWDGGVRRR